MSNNYSKQGSYDVMRNITEHNSVICLKKYTGWYKK